MSAIELAVNHAIENSRISRMRQAAYNPAYSHAIDAKRANSWSEYGFPNEISFEMLFNLYRRGGIAFGAIERLVNTCWSQKPEVIEGGKYEKDKAETKWEKSLLKVTTVEFWRNLLECDRRRLVGKYSALILRIADNGKWSDPVKPSLGLRIVGTVPAWRGSLKPRSFETSETSENYGKVKTWEYVESSTDGSPTRTLEIHSDRIFIFGDWRNDSIAFLEPAYNSFVSLEKVEGGSGESFLKNASRQISVAFDKEVDLEGLARLYGVPLSELREKFDEAARELNRGNDAMLVTQGANVAPMVSQIADPKPTFDVILQTISAATDIPSKILVGMQTGERASTEDQKYFNSRCQARRENDLSFEIKNLIEKLISLKIIEPVAEFSIEWDDLRESTGSEKLANAKTMAEINQISINGGNSEVFQLAEVRTAAGFDNEEDGEGDSKPLAENQD